MRQGPSEQYTMIKRSFFSRGTTSHQLDNVVVAMKGVYTSIRLCSVSFPLLLIICMANQIQAYVFTRCCRHWLGFER